MIKYTYTLKRSSRRSVSVCVKDDNTITVNAPLRMPIKDIEKFLLSKSGWIESHMHRNECNDALLSEIISYKKVLVAGKELPLILGENNAFSENEVRAKSVKHLKKLFIDNLGEQFLEMFNAICEANNFKCGNVGFKDYKSKWGCCDRASNIIFNYKLLMLPQRLWRYVAVHELCHTVYMNHSKSFYSLVQSVLPDYKTDVRQLKLYSRLTRLY